MHVSAISLLYGEFTFRENENHSDQSDASCRLRNVPEKVQCFFVIRVNLCLYFYVYSESTFRVPFREAAAQGERVIEAGLLELCIVSEKSAIFFEKPVVRLPFSLLRGEGSRKVNS